MAGNSLLLSDSPCTTDQRRCHLSLLHLGKLRRPAGKVPIVASAVAAVAAALGRSRESDSLYGSLGCTRGWCIGGRVMVFQRMFSWRFWLEIQHVCICLLGIYVMRAHAYFMSRPKNTTNWWRCSVLIISTDEWATVLRNYSSALVSV